MDGKTEGQTGLVVWPILLMVDNLSADMRERLESGLEGRKLNYRVHDYNDETTHLQISKVVVAAGRDAFRAARVGLKDSIIYAIPDVSLFIDNKWLAPIVAEHLRMIQDSVSKGSSTSPSIPTTTIRSTPSRAHFNPRDSGITLPTEGLTKDELYKLFESQFSEDPFVFWSGTEEVAIYLGEPEGRIPIEFSLEEFFTILKLTQLTKAKTIIWREPDANAE